jgi:hypothetical protein
LGTLAKYLLLSTVAQNGGDIQVVMGKMRSSRLSIHVSKPSKRRSPSPSFTGHSGAFILFIFWIAPVKQGSSRD